MKTLSSIILACGTLSLPAQLFLDHYRSQFKDRYIPGVGLALFDSEADRPFGRCNVSALPTYRLLTSGVDGWRNRAIDPGAIMNNVEDSETWQRTLITLRIQDTLQKTGQNAGSATFNYTTGDEETMQLKGAAIFDFYLPSTLPVFGYQTGDEGLGFHFRLGAQVERAFKTDPGMGLDQREYFFGVNFLSPILTDDGLRAAAASDFNFGYHIKENGITGERSNSVIFEWRPAYRQLFGRDFSLSDLLSGNLDFLFASPQRNETMEIAEMASSQGGQSTENESLVMEGGEMKEGTEIGNTLNSLIGKPRFNIQPRFELEQFVQHAIGREEGLCGCAGLDLTVITLSDQLVFTYSVDLAHSFDEGESHVFHRATLDYKLDTIIEDFSINASYVSGRRAPDFVDQELFSVGFGLQF